MTVYRKGLIIMASNFPQTCRSSWSESEPNILLLATASFIEARIPTPTGNLQYTQYTVAPSLREGWAYLRSGAYNTGKNTFAHKVDFQNLSTSCPLHSLKQAFDKCKDPFVPKNKNDDDDCMRISFHSAHVKAIRTSHPSFATHQRHRTLVTCAARWILLV